MSNAIQPFHSYFYIFGRKFRDISMMCRNIYRKKDLLQEDGALKIKALIPFSINERNMLIKRSPDICKKQHYPIEEQRVQ